MLDDLLTQKVIGFAIEVHRNLGPGLLESSYEACLAHELTSAKINHQTQVLLPIQYKDIIVEAGYRIDMMIDNRLIIELKATTQLQPIHTAQLLTYMKLAKIKTGLLINFNEQKLTDGVKRLVI